MKERIQAISKKSLSLFLALIMMFSVLPAGSMAVDAATPGSQRGFDLKNYLQVDSSWSNKVYGKGSIKNTGCGILSTVNAVYNVTGNFINPEILASWAHKNGYYNKTGAEGSYAGLFTKCDDKFGDEYNFKVVGNGTGNIKSANLVNHLNNGGTAVVHVPGHFMAIVDYNKDNGKYLVFDCAPGSGTSYNSIKRRNLTSPKGDWKTADQLSQGNLKVDRFYLFSSTKKSYTVTANEANNITNSSVTLNAGLNQTANVQKWGYYLSTNKSEVTNVDGVNNATKTHVDTKTMDYCRVNDWNSSPKSKKDLSVTVKKILGKNLAANTTYYYKFVVKIGGKWYQSGVKNFKTGQTKPGAATLNISSGYSDIGLKDTATVSWSSSSNTDSYTLRLYNSSGTKVYEKTGVKSNTFSYPSSCFTKAGTYTAEIVSVNSYSSTVGSAKPKITVHNNVNVTFYDTITNTDIITQSVVYGHDASAPENPSQTGYTFVKWDSSYSKVKADTTVKAVFEANKYTVKFVDSLTGKVLKTETVKYHQSATAPTTDAMSKIEHQGYKFIGWDVDFSQIEGDTTVNTNYEWYNENYPVSSAITAVEQDKENENGTEINGYKVSVSVTNGTSASVKKGRLVIALKTETGYLLTETESSAFTLKAKETKNIDVFVPYGEFAHTAEVYTINEYGDLGPVAKPVSMKIDNSNKWSEWIEYTDTVPVTVGVDGVSDVETKTETSPNVTQYRYRTKTTTTSYSTSLSGYTQNGGTWVSQGQSTLDYVSNWPSGFNTTNSLYKKYNVTPKKASETATTKVTVDSTATLGYIYWHWCRGGSYGAINRGIAWSKTSTYNTFHAFYSTTSKSFDSSANAIKWQNTSQCKDTYWWNSEKSKSSTKVTVKRQKYTTYKKLFNYYKWSNWSSWSTTPQTSSSTKEVQTQTIQGTTTKYYRYKTDVPAKDVSVSNEQIVNINGTVDKTLANREVSVYVYKYTQAADYTNEYLGTTKVGANGEVVINNAKLREAPTIETGDYTIVASVEGCTNAIEIGKVYAPKRVFTVDFYDYDNKTIIYSEKVEQGDTVTSPDISKLNIPEGYKFTNWNQSTVNVNGNLQVYPQFEKEEYVVVFVDWGSKDVKLLELSYGEELEKYLPEIESPEGIKATWDLTDATKIEDILSDGTKTEKYIVTQNTVVTTVYETESYDVKFIAPTEKACENIDVSNLDEIDSILDEREIAVTDSVDYDTFIDAPEYIDESPDYIFIGWKNIATGEYLGNDEDTSAVEDGIYVPEYTFAETVDVPEASVKTGEYSSNQTVELTCATDKAVIYYTTDGTNPETSETAIEYTTPITLTKSCNLQFCAMSLGKNNSGVVSELYAINTSTSGKSYHIVSVYSDLPQSEGEYYQALIKDSTLFKDDDLQSVEGYTYNGLFIDESHSEPFFNDSEVVTSSMNLYASYTPFVYTATFVDEDGTLIAKVNADYGDTAEEPVAPEKAGYVFVGWDSEDYLCMTKDGTFTAQYVSEDEYAKVEFTGKSSRECMAGTSLKLSRLVKITPADMSDAPLIWSSSNPDIAEVDENGVVTMLNPGTATITVMVESSGEEAKFEITVTPNSELQITLAKNSILDFDEQRYLRRIPDKANTVNELKDEFVNDELHYYDVNGNELSYDDKIGTGAVIKLLDGDKVLDEVTVIMTGDYNGDGNINSRDVSMLMQHTVDLREINQYQAIALDVNGDGKVNNRDSAILSAYLVGKADIA